MPYFSESVDEPISGHISGHVSGYIPGHAASGNSVSPEFHRALIALETGDFYSRWEAAKLISACGIEALQRGSLAQVIEPLLNLLQADDLEEEVGWYVARILGAFDHPLAVQGLTHLLQTSQSADVAGMAATALANCGAAAIPPLTDLLHQPEMRLLAIRTLAQIQHPEVVEVLLTLTSDPLATVRSTAIDALSRFTSPAILEALLVALHDPESSVRRSAVSAIGFQAQSLDPDFHEEPVSAEKHSLLVKALQPLLWDVNLEVCCQTALTLGRIGTPDAIAELCSVLQSHSTPLLQQAIIRAIGWIETPETVIRLQQVMFNCMTLAEESQLEMITVLGRLRQTESSRIAIQTLLDLLRSHHSISQTSKGKQTIAHSLGQLISVIRNIPSSHRESSDKQSDEVITALIYLLEDSDSGVQLHVIAALKAFDDRSVNSKLISLTHSETISTNLHEGITVALEERKRLNRGL